MADLSDIAEAVINRDIPGVARLTEKKLSEGIRATEILNDGLLAGMAVVGAKFKILEIYVPEVLVSAKAMNTGVDILKPHLQGENVPSKGKMVLGTVKGDIHDVGKNLVTIMMEGSGFEVIDLGTNVPTDKFVNAINEHKPDIVGMSSLLTTTMREFKKNIEAFKDAGVRNSVKVMVGGAPVSEEFALEAGADAYGADAIDAVEKANALVKEV